MKILEVETFVEILIERIEFSSDRLLTLSSYFEQSTTDSFTLWMLEPILIYSLVDADIYIYIDTYP